MTKSLTGVGIRGFMFKFKCKFKIGKPELWPLARLV
jgi:hypothetical protein